jgi:16S rRNA (cytidine1402-2'-O)-methyltransferase
LHTHNENDRSQQILDNIPESGSMALISDAGTPLISDPGFTLIDLAIKNNIQVVPIPGACAAIAALSVSGIPANKFCFEGFIPAKQQERTNYLSSLKHETRTMIFYEAPHRIIDTLKDCIDVFGLERKIAFAREVTKQFEIIKTTSIAELYEFVSSDPMQQKGEIVLVISGVKESKLELTSRDINTLNVLLSELTVKQASALAAKITSKSKNLFYEYALANKN